MHKTKHVLHVVGPLRRGGTEVWLENIVQLNKTSNIHFSILSIGDDGETLCPRFRELGVPLHFVSATKDPIKMARALYQVFKTSGTYDAVHAHVEFFSGLVVLIASLAGIKTRIVHCHTDCRTKRSHLTWQRKLYQNSMSQLVRWFSTDRVGASKVAAQSMFGTQSAKIIYCGVNLDQFTMAAQEKGIQRRQALGIGDRQIVLGHVGRMETVKRHELLLEILQNVLEEGVDAQLVLVGDGSLRAQLENKADQMNLKDRAHFVGERPEIGEYLSGVFDVFVFPSRYEGLGLALVEAQAAGLPCVTSRVIPPEAFVIPELVHVVNASAGLNEWTDAVLREVQKVSSDHLKKSDHLQSVQQSPFSAEVSFQSLVSLYRESVST